MKVTVTLDARYSRTPDGAVWTSEAPSHRFWTRYLSAFEAVTVLARVRDVARVADGAHRVDGAAVHVHPLPYYVGPARYLRHRVALGRAVGTAAAAADAVVLRVPSPIGSLMAAARERLGLPYAVEVVADPYDAYAPGVIDHPARPWLRTRFTGRLRHECRHAVAVSYVTDRALQRRYPADPRAVRTNCSSVELPPDAFRAEPRVATGPRERPTLISVGSLNQMYKGVDVLLTAVARLTRDGTPVRLVHVGDGVHRPRVEQLAHRLGIADRVTFTGLLPAGPAVRDRLDAADLFVMPSRTEGLPCALIEAMARALPAVGTRVGGIPELLPADDLVAADDPAALARTVGAVLSDPGRMAAASARNLDRAREFSADVLAARRSAFYEAVAAAHRGAHRGAQRDPVDARDLVDGPAA